MSILSAPGSPSITSTPATPPSSEFVFVAERLWLDFINTDDLRRGVRIDVLRDFESLVRWLEVAAVLDAERGLGIIRRAEQQPEE